jgi:predicted RNase H-like nuclease (RuvC/YqgF family)
MRYLGIDAGGTSGAAIIDANGEVIAWMNVAPEDIETSVLKVFAADPETSVCIEYPANVRTSKDQEPMQQAVAALRRLFPNAYTVQPGVWKTSAVASQPIPAGKHISQHQKDAVGIARWHRLQMLKQQEQNNG